MNIIGFSSRREFEGWLDHEWNYPFTGWDFAHISSRFATGLLPFSYTTEVLTRLRSGKVHRLLDMGTGGGEYLASNLQPFPPYTRATEAYPPNVPVATQRLQPLGAKVVQIGEDNHLPFPDADFDLIINQHEEFNPDEVFRVLRHGGEFITKQVDGDNDRDLYRLFQIPYPGSHWHLDFAVHGLENAGFTISRQQVSPMITRITDVGAIIYYLKIAPWAIEDFDYHDHIDALIALHNQIAQNGFYDIVTPRFLIIAQKQ